MNGSRDPSWLPGCHQDPADGQARNLVPPAHAVRELCLHLPDAVGVVKLDYRQIEARSEEFIKAWEAARLPDDAGGFPVCGEVVT